MALNGGKKENNIAKAFCNQILKPTMDTDKDWRIDPDPNEEIALLFDELKKRKELAQKEYNFDLGLPRAIIRSFQVRPSIYSDVEGFWVIKESGIPVISFSSSRDRDGILLAGFFGAVSNFAETLQDELQEILLVGTRFLFQREPELGLIFALASKSIQKSQGLKLLSEIRHQFTTRYSHLFSTATDIVYTTQFKTFANLIQDKLINSGLEVYLETGVLRQQNPLLFQLAKTLLPFTDQELLILRLLEKKPDQVFSISKFLKSLNIPESRLRGGLRQLEDLELIQVLKDGRSKKYASNIRNYLFQSATDPKLHPLVDHTVKDLLDLIDERLARALQ